MRCSQVVFGLSLAGVVLLAADLPWKDKPVASWTDADLKMILMASPLGQDRNGGRRSQGDRRRTQSGRKYGRAKGCWLRQRRQAAHHG